MNNFGTLYYYELKKLLKRPLSWVVVLFLAGLFVWWIFKTGTSFTGTSLPVLDENGNETEEYHTFSGEELYNIYAESAKKLNGRVVDDELFQEMLEDVPDLDGLALDWYFLAEDYTWDRLYSMIWLSDIRSVTAEKFYAAQWEETQKTWEEYGLSEGEKAYWTKKAAQIEKPWVYQAPWAGTGQAFSGVYTLLFFLPLVVAVCVCTLFSEDRRTRAESLVFTTRKSRTSLYLAKILAGVTVTALAAMTVIGVIAVSLIFVWGTDGLSAPIQFYTTVSPRPITIGQMFLPILLMLVLFALLYGGLTMLISMATHNALAALGGPVVLSFVMNMTNYSLWDGRLADYFRLNLMGMKGVSNVRLVNLFGVYLDNFQSGALLYLTVIVLMLALCWPFWRRSVDGRL